MRVFECSRRLSRVARSTGSAHGQRMPSRQSPFISLATSLTLIRMIKHLTAWYVKNVSRVMSLLINRFVSIQSIAFSPSHLCASTFHSMPARIMTCQCFLSSQSSSGFLPYRLSPGLAISALVCLDFTFRLPSSAISFSRHHLYLSFVHVRTISTSSL